MSLHEKKFIEGFTLPTALPASAQQQRKWQEVNQSWWEENPMRYDWKQKVNFKEFSKEFYLEIDRRFFRNSQEYMPWKNIPFDPLIDFEKLSSLDVLEIGVGQGSHAQLLAQHAKSFVGIDITDYAVKSTMERMRRFGVVDAKILRMDAEELNFPDNSFDFIWSWGVVHHSANTRRILQEMRRVLKNNGKAVVMVYHRNFWNYYILGGFFRGILQGGFLKTRSLHEVIQNYTDGALARYYTADEWSALVSDLFAVHDIRVYGNKSDLVPLPGGRLKETVLKMFPCRVSRFFTNRLKLGGFLVVTLIKLSDRNNVIV